MPVTDITKDLDNRTLTITADFTAPVERVWQVYADPRRLERVWGPPTYPATFHAHALEPGGRMNYVMTGPEGDQHAGFWDITAVDEPNSFDYAYSLDAPIEEKIRLIATRVYGADGVELLPAAKKKAADWAATDLARLPICMAKTHLSLSHDPALKNAPTGFTVTVRDLRPYTGAGWIVALCGDMMTMPGLGKAPAAYAIDIDSSGETVGLF